MYEYKTKLIKKKIKCSSYLHTYKEIQSGAVAKSYMMEGLPNIGRKRKYFTIYEEAVIVSHI